MARCKQRAYLAILSEVLWMSLDDWSHNAVGLKQRENWELVDYEIHEERPGCSALFSTSRNAFGLITIVQVQTCTWSCEDEKHSFLPALKNAWRASTFFFERCAHVLFGLDKLNDKFTLSYFIVCMYVWMDGRMNGLHDKGKMCGSDWGPLVCVLIDEQPSCRQTNLGSASR